MKKSGTSGKPVIRPVNTLMTRGIQTMLRLTSDNHLRLSQIADGKANILISINAIIVAVIISGLSGRLGKDKHLIIPTVIFLSSSVVTLILSVLATRPQISKGTFDEKDVLSKKTNILFFGNFYRVPANEYENAMRQMMTDQDYLYGTLIRDIYTLGIVLAGKYKILRTAYNVFMFGIIISVISFGIAVYLHYQSGSDL